MASTCTMIRGDCLEVMKSLPTNSAQFIYADLPFATTLKKCTANTWDSVFPLAMLWEQIEFVRADGAQAAFSCQQPFASVLVMSRVKEYRQELVYRKRPTNWFNAQKMPLRNHANVLVFGAKPGTYNPQLTPRKGVRRDACGGGSINYHQSNPAKNKGNPFFMPVTLLEIKDDPSRFVGAKRRIHPTQKPVSLLDWLIRTYSNPGDTVLDPVSGSGTTACAAALCGRNSVCIEKDEGYFEAGVDRIQKLKAEHKLDVAIKIRR